MYKQIGNAVPVLLAQKVAEGIKKELQKDNDKQRNRRVREKVFK